MTVDRIAQYYANGGGQGHSTRAIKGWQQSNGVTPLTDGWAMYRRFNVNAEPVWITDADGAPRWLTTTQARIASRLMALCDKGAIRWTTIAKDAGVAVSTVSRVAWKLQAYGLIRFVTGRGRYGGTIMVKAVINDGLERLRKVAKAKVRQWAIASRKAAEERISRLRFNVAPRESMTGRVVSTITTTVDATLTAQPFSVQDLRDVGII